MVNIAGAFEALKAMDTVKTPITIVSKAPVKHAMAHLHAISEPIRFATVPTITAAAKLMLPCETR